VYEATNHLVQGQLYYKKRRYDQSIAELEKAVTVYPGDQNTVYLLSYVKETYLNKLLTMAEENFKEDRITDALGLYFKALELKPDNAEVYNFIGMCFSTMGDYDSAINAVNTALFYDSENFQFHFNLASLLASIGHYDESKKELEMSIRLNPDFTRAREALQQLTDFLDNQ
jgi:tetratricopeptide (TPR) repeat protein